MEHRGRLEHDRTSDEETERGTRSQGRPGKDDRAENGEQDRSSDGQNPVQQLAEGAGSTTPSASPSLIMAPRAGRSPAACSSSWRLNGRNAPVVDKRAGVSDVGLGVEARRPTDSVNALCTDHRPTRTRQRVGSREAASVSRRRARAALARIAAAPAARRAPCRCLRRARAACAAESSGRRGASGSRRTRRRARSARPRERRTPVDLRPAGEPRSHGEPLPLPLVVLLDLVAQRRARPDQAHFAPEDVPELRQLVDGGLAQDPADARDAAVARSTA